MNERLEAYLSQARAFWSALTVARRVALVGTTLAVALAVGAASYAGSRVSYGMLFTDLNPEDGAAMTAKLKELKVPFRVEASGTAIAVPEEKVHELRLELAGQGLPRGGGVGFEIFDRSHLGATEFEQRIHLKRALEGELARTIGTIGAVQGARVHLVMPERSLFAASREQASASVILRMRPGRTFGKAEVASVVHLVASAVPGLAEDHVSIVGADGLTLHRPRGDAPASGADQRSEREAEMASSLEEHARAIVERMVGAGHAEVRVGIELDPSVHERTEEHFDPTKSALRSEQKSEEHAGAGESTTVAGVPGAGTALDTGPVPDTTTSPDGGVLPSGIVRQSWTRNFEVDRVTEKTSTPAGRVARMSVAVLVDGSYKGAAGAREFVPRDRAELDKLSELVKGSIGFSAARGDTIQVDTAPFATGEGPDVGDAVPGLPRTQIIGIGAGAFAILVIGGAVFAFRRRKSAATGLALVPSSATTTASYDAVEDEVDVRVLGAREATRERALGIASRDPATAAVILREWLHAPTAAAVTAARF